MQSILAAWAALALIVGGVADPAPALAGPSYLCDQDVGGVTVATFDADEPCFLMGPGIFTVTDGGAINALTLHDLTMVNEGVLTQDECHFRPLNIWQGSQFENAGQFAVQSCGLESRVEGPGPAINDAGATWTVTGSQRITTEFWNDGTLDLAPGSIIELPQLGNLSQGTLTGGVWRLEQPAGHIDFPGEIRRNAADLQVIADNSLRTTRGQDAIGRLNDNSGTLDVEVDQEVGALANSGVLTMGGDATLQSKALTLAPDSELGVTVHGDRAYSRVQASGRAVVGGTLDIATDPSFDPIPGATYRILSSSAGVSGRFTTVTGTTIDSHRHYEVMYGPRSVGLRVVTDEAIPLTVDKAKHHVEQNATGFAFTVNGSGFAPGAKVDFGGPDVVAAHTAVVDNTRLTVTAASDPTATLGARDITVTNPDGDVAVCRRCLQVSAGPPGVSVAQPVGAGAIDVPVVLDTAGYAQPLSAASVSGPSPLTTSFDQDSLIVSAPSTATPGNYDVHVVGRWGGEADCLGCLVVKAAPVVTDMTPNALRRGVTTTVTLHGDGFAPGASFEGPFAVTFGSATVSDPTVMTVPIHVGNRAAPLPQRVLTVINGADGGYGRTTFSNWSIT